MEQLAQINWHELPEQEAVRLIETDRAHGLTPAEVEARACRCGFCSATVPVPEPC